MEFKIRTTNGSDVLPVDDDNIDIRIELADGRVYVATFFTIHNLSTLMQRHKTSGECANGTYIWASDMIVVARIDLDSIQKTVSDLLLTGEIESACTRIA